MLSAAYTGFLTSLSLILAIGAQNTFVIRQGLTGQHVFWLCLFCGMSDALLIGTGVAGFGTLVASYPALIRYLLLAAAAFLTAYGILRFIAAWRGNYEITDVSRTRTVGSTLLLATLFTWGNPHVYLDTLGLIGAISTGFSESAKWAFGGGAVLASFVFFFSLGYGAKQLAPFMRSPRAWRMLDTAVGAIMLWIAVALVSAA